MASNTYRLTLPIKGVAARPLQQTSKPELKIVSNEFQLATATTVSTTVAHSNDLHFSYGLQEADFKQWSNRER